MLQPNDKVISIGLFSDRPSVCALFPGRIVFGARQSCFAKQRPLMDEDDRTRVSAAQPSNVAN